MSDIDPVEFGALKATVAALKDDMDTMKADVRVIRDAITEARGGWKTVMLIGGAAATIGGAIVWLLQHTADRITPP